MYENHTCPIKESPKLYKIGMFAQINRITIKALRYYDDVGLLHPEMVNEENGYRYYTSAQLPRLHKILALREMDFSIEQIKQILEGASEETMLLRKRSECMKQLSNITMKLASIDSYLSGNYLKSDCRVVMKSLPAVKIAYMHVNLTSYSDLLYQMPYMGMEMEKVGCECAEPDYCFNIYYDESYQEENINVDICEAVTQLKEDNEKLKFKELPEVELAACLLHKGSYHLLSKTYQAVVGFIEESGYEIDGKPRESYIDGIWNKDSEEEWLTEIQFPVRKIKV